MERFGNASLENMEGNSNQRDQEDVPQTGTSENNIFGVSSDDEQEYSSEGASSISDGVSSDDEHENNSWSASSSSDGPQAECHENSVLRQEKEQLRLENIALKDAIENMYCSDCGCHVTSKDESLDNLLLGNALLKDELSRLTSIYNQMTGSTSSGGGSSRIQAGLQRNYYLELASKAMDELMKLGQVNAPLWISNVKGGGETLNLNEYTRSFPPRFGPKPLGFVSEASRARGVVLMSSMDLVESLLDANRWKEMFTSMIGSSTTLEMISSGTSGSRNGALQLMRAEIQLISPLVPARVVKFIRYSRQQAEGVWVVVDLSLEAGTIRRPSGCILRDMANGYTMVTWIEHTEYNENLVNDQYRRLLSSGLGFGAQKWICALLRHCECLQAITSPIANHGLFSNTRRCLRGLAQRMTTIFCASVCLTGGQQWDLVSNHTPETPKIIARKTRNDLGEPLGTILSVAFSFWVPTAHRHLFDLLLKKELRCVWDVLCHANATEKTVHLPLGLDESSPNSISILSSNDPIMLLQETASDMTGSLIVYAPVDHETVTAVMTCIDTSSASLLPSGIYIVPAGLGEHGSMVTLGFQVLIPGATSCVVTMDSIMVVKELVSRTVQGIKYIVQSRQRGQ